MNSIILFALFVVFISPLFTPNCHSSCLSCNGPLYTDCESCDGPTLTMDALGSQIICVGVNDYTTVLSYIDANWVGMTHYFFSISTQAGEYANALDIGHPLTLSYDVGGTNYYGFNFAGLPTNHFAI